MTSNACESVCLKELFGGGSQKSETQIHFSAALAHLVERHLAKVEVASSSLVSRSIWRCGKYCSAKILWCRSQVVRQRSAKPLCTSSNLVGTSKKALVF